MSLKLWIPLNGNTNNYGLSGDIAFIERNEAGYDDGKIGRCKKFDGSNLLIADYSFELPEEGSLCMWALWDNFPGSSSNDWLVDFADTSGYANAVLALSIYHGSKIAVCLGGSYDASVNTHDYSSNETFTTGKWYHICITWNSIGCILYIDGILHHEYRTLTERPLVASSKFSIGANVVNSTTRLRGKLNDIRLYDHCLSAKEVKEISKGLVLHYTMDENVQQLNNCFNYPTFNTSTASGGWSHWAPSGSTGSYSQNTDKTYIYNKNQTYSHKVSHLTGERYLCYQSPAFEGGFRSVQAIIKLEDGSHPKGKVSFSHNANVLNKPTEYIELGDGFYLMRKQGFKQDGSNDLVSIYLANNAVVYISEAYLENDREVCSNILNLRSNVVHDASGYCNDGVITGTLALSTDTPRYNLSTEFGDGRCILPSLWPSFLTNEATVSMWVKLDQLPPSSPGRTMLYTAWYGFSCEINSSGKTYFRTYLSNSGTTDSPQGTIGVGEWFHWVGVKSSTGVSLYLNGILIGTTSNTDNFNWSSIQSNKIASYSNSYFTYGKISDLRLYATALSDEDIKELYDTAAFIDNLGNVSCYEFEEQNENLLKYEYTIIGTNTSNTATRGKYTIRNDVPAMAFKATDTYWSSAYHHVMLAGRFKENTQYVFDLWLDTDDVVTGGNNVAGGFTIYYTDDTTSSSSLRCTGSQAEPKGWQHKLYISTAGKTVSDIIVYYNTSATFYVRADSFITPIYDTDIKNTGVIDTSQFIENTDVAFIGRGDVNSNKFLEI